MEQKMAWQLLNGSSSIYRIIRLAGLTSKLRAHTLKTIFSFLFASAHVHRWLQSTAVPINNGKKKQRWQLIVSIPQFWWLVNLCFNWRFTSLPRKNKTMFSLLFMFLLFLNFYKKTFPVMFSHLEVMTALYFSPVHWELQCLNPN